MKIIEDSEKVHDSEIKCQALGLEPRSSESPKPHISATRPQPCDTQWTFILHTLTPRIQGWLQLPFLYQGFVFSYQAVAWVWATTGVKTEGEPSLAWGSISGVFSVSAPDKVTPSWAEALFIPSLQPDNLWIRTSVCNKSLCLQLYQWFSAGAMVLPSVWRHFSWSKIAGGEWEVATGL